MTAADGSYQFANLAVEVDYTITAKNAGYSIKPASKEFSLVEGFTD
jgi:hypothetical protein